MRSLRVRDWLNLIVAAAVFASILAFYRLTGPGDIAWLEGAENQRRVALVEAGEGPWDRPLYVLLSQPFLLFEPESLPRRATLASAVFAAATCLFIYLFMKRLLEVAPQFIARRVGVLAAGSLAVAHTFWLRAVTPGPEVLDCLLLAVILFCLLRFANEGRAVYLYVATAALGLSLSSNLMFLFFVPLVAVWIRFVRPPLIRDIGVVRARGLVLFLVGSSLAIGIAAWGWAVGGFHVAPERWTWVTFWRHHMMVAWAPPLQESLTRFGLLLLYNFPPWTALIAAVGLVELFRRQKYVFWLVFPLLLVYSALVVTLTLPDPIPSYLPAWVLLSVAVGYGWWKVLSESTWKGFLLAFMLCLSPVVLYRFAAPAVTRLGQEFRVRTLFQTPFESPLDSLELALNPDRGRHPDARGFATQVLAELPESARIVAASKAGERIIAPARYLADVEAARSGLTWTSAGPGDEADLRQWASQGEPPLFLVGLHPPNPAVEKLLDAFDFVPSGHLFRVSPRRGVEVDATQPSDTLVPLPGEWSGFVRPQGYALAFSIWEASDGTLAGKAVLNSSGARPLEGSFLRITVIGDSVLARVTYEDRAHIHVDAAQRGRRLEGTWRIFEDQSLSGTFVVWKR